MKIMTDFIKRHRMSIGYKASDFKYAIIITLIILCAVLSVSFGILVFGLDIEIKDKIVILISSIALFLGVINLKVFVKRSARVRILPLLGEVEIVDNTTPVELYFYNNGDFNAILILDDCRIVKRQNDRHLVEITGNRQLMIEPRCYNKTTISLSKALKDSAGPIIILIKGKYYSSGIYYDLQDEIRFNVK